MQKSKILLILGLSLIMMAWGRSNGYTQIKITIPDIKTQPGKGVFIPVLISDVSDYEIIAYQFVVKFDSLVVRAVGVSVQNTLTENWGDAISNTNFSGKMVVGAFGVSALTQGDTLLYLIFDAIAKPGAFTSIILEELLFNGGNSKTIIHNGILKIDAPTAIGDRIFGRVPPDLKLLSNYPDPFHERTLILAQFNQPCKIEIDIFNLLGQIIKQVSDLTANTQFSYDWDATDKRGTRVSPGIYFCVVKQNEKIIAVDRMVLLK